MNWKKFFIAFVVTWIFIFVYGWIFHGMIMHSSYQQTPALFRPEAEFKANFLLLVIGLGVIAFFFTLIFVRGFGSGGGVTGGFRYGILLGLLICGANLVRYAVEPLTGTILVGWWIGEIIEFAIAGLIVGALYKPSSTIA
jgi:hypothetical protein